MIEKIRYRNANIIEHLPRCSDFLLKLLAVFLLQTTLEMLNDRTDELQETVLGMKNRMKTMQCNQEEIHKMLQGIVKKLEAIVEGDDDDDDQLF